MRRLVIVATVAAVAAGLLGGVAELGGVDPDRLRGAPAAADESTAVVRPNIVVILMDDFSQELLGTMRQAQRMRARGATYDNALVVDSLCCPSRTSLLTGRYPHQTGVLTNTARDPAHPIGGYAAFRHNENGARAFNVALHASGYTTGYIGKFLNRYEPRWRDGVLRPPRRVPGWDDWQVIFGGGYNGWGFYSSYIEDGVMKLRRHSRPPLSASVAARDRGYATHVTTAKALRFIRRHRDDENPYFLEIATYAPHGNLDKAYPADRVFPPAFRDRAGARRPGGNCGLRACSDLTVRDLQGWNDSRGDNAPTYLRRGGRTAPAPAWRTNPITLTAEAALEQYRDRARMVQAVDRLIARVRAEVGPNTYVVLTADNGFHLGQHQLNGGKGAPYDSDTRVPLVVTGPGVVPGNRSQFVSNVDLAPTFEELAGLEPAPFRAGNSFAASLRDPRAVGNRFAFVEHSFGLIEPGEVDGDTAVGGHLGHIPSYVAVRSRRGLLVRVDLDPSWTGHRYAWELYRYDVPWEDRNVFAQDYGKPYAQVLRRRLMQFVNCTAEECRRAAR